jgi:hypothetical protein
MQLRKIRHKAPSASFETVRHKAHSLVHVGKDTNKEILAAYAYAGVKVVQYEPHALICADRPSFRFDLETHTPDTITLLVNRIQIFTLPIQVSSRERIVLMAWGDGHPHYEYDVTEIKVERA